MAKNLVFIIPAAGSGTRMHSDIPKILLPIEGRSVISRTLEAVSAYSSVTDLKVSCVIVTTAELNGELTSLVKESFPELSFLVTPGGASRTESVSNGVSLVPSLVSDIAADDIVLIHDGARCLVTEEVIEGVVSGLKTSPVCVAAVPVKDTLKITKTEGDKTSVVSTPDRSSIYAVQTPQGFRYETLVKCYDYAKEMAVNPTDDTALAEMLGIEVAISEGDYSNIKITTPEDIAVAASILGKRL